MTEQMNVPKLRFSEFDGEWQKLTLKQVSSKNISYGVVQTGDKDLTVPCVRVVDLTSGSLNRETFIKTSEAINQSYKKTILESGELMVALRGVIGLTRAVPVDLVGCNLTRGIARISPDQKRFSSQFIEQALNTPKSSQRFDQLKNGSALKEISIGELNKYSTDYPHLKEQQKIASFLSKVDEKITLLTEKKAKLTEYKKGVMQQLFSGKWEEQDGQLTFIPPTLRFKADDGSEFPDWKEKTLGDVLTIGNGRDYKHLSGGDIPVFGTGGYMTSVDGYLYDGETVFIGRKGTINKPYMFNGKFWTVDTLFYTKEFKGILPKFVYAMFQKINWSLYNEATGVPSLSKSTINKIKLNLPSLSEQEKITNFLLAIDHKIDLTNSELDKAKEWKKGLLQQMFV